MDKTASRSFLLFAFLHCFVLVFAVGLTGLGVGGVFGAQGSEQAILGERLLLAGSGLTGLAGLLLILSLVTGVALRSGASWALWLARVTAWLGAVEFPVGTAFAINWFRRQRRRP